MQRGDVSKTPPCLSGRDALPAFFMPGGVVADERPEAVTVLCQDCGTLVEVKDVRALILSLHLSNDCTLSTLLVHRAE